MTWWKHKVYIAKMAIFCTIQSIQITSHLRLPLQRHPSRPQSLDLLLQRKPHHNFLTSTPNDMNPHIPTDMLDPRPLASLIIPSPSHNLLRFANTLLKRPGCHHFEQSRHAADSDIVRGSAFGEFEDVRELFHEGVGGLNHQAEFEDLGLDGLLLDEGGAECFTLDGVVEGVFGAYAG